MTGTERYNLRPRSRKRRTKSLLQVPAELREMIYSQLFDGHITGHVDGLMHLDHKLGASSCDERKDLSLLFTCKQIHEELLGWISRNHTLRIQILDICELWSDNDNTRDFTNVGIPKVYKNIQLALMMLRLDDYWDLQDMHKGYDETWNQMTTFMRAIPGRRLINPVTINVEHLSRHKYDFAACFRGCLGPGLVQSAHVQTFEDEALSTLSEEVDADEEDTAFLQSMLTNAETYRQVIEQIKHRVSTDGG